MAEQIREPFEKFVDSFRVGTLWRCSDGRFFFRVHQLFKLPTYLRETGCESEMDGTDSELW
jgi:hypothetical protein